MRRGKSQKRPEHRAPGGSNCPRLVTASPPGATNRQGAGRGVGSSGDEVARGCRCSVVHFEEVLARFPKEDRNDMRDENGIIRVDCAFCSREFLIED